MLLYCELTSDYKTHRVYRNLKMLNGEKCLLGILDETRALHTQPT